MAGGVAVIKVGAATETEMKEKKLRIEDALNATKAAVEAVSYTHLVCSGFARYVSAPTASAVSPEAMSTGTMLARAASPITESCLFIPVSYTHLPKGCRYTRFTHIRQTPSYSLVI